MKNTLSTAYSLIEDNGGTLHLYVFENDEITYASTIQPKDVQDALAELNDGGSPVGWDSDIDDAQASWDQWTDELRRNGAWEEICDQSGHIPLDDMGGAGQIAFS